MKTKIIGLLICMLLIAPVLSATSIVEPKPTGDWIDVGQPGGDGYETDCLTLYNNKLYAAKDSAYVYQYDGGTSWISIGQAGDPGHVFVLHVFDGTLYAGKSLGEVYRYDGNSTWTYVGRAGPSHVFSMAVYNNKLYAATYNSTSV